MGKAMSALIRPLRNYNVSNRAQKKIASQRTDPAPKHPTTIKYMQQIKSQEKVDEIVKIPQKHLDRLKQVHVTSKDVPLVEDKEKRKLPQSRTKIRSPEFGFQEPDFMPAGKISMRQAVELLTRHSKEPKKWTSQVIAKEYKLDEGVTEKLLFYFRLYDVWMPPSTKDQSWKDKSKTFIRQTQNDAVPRIK